MLIRPLTLAILMASIQMHAPTVYSTVLPDPSYSIWTELRFYSKNSKLETPSFSGGVLGSKVGVESTWVGLFPNIGDTTDVVSVSALADGKGTYNRGFVDIQPGGVYLPTKHFVDISMRDFEQEKRSYYKLFEDIGGYDTPNNYSVTIRATAVYPIMISADSNCIHCSDWVPVDFNYVNRFSGGYLGTEIPDDNTNSLWFSNKLYLSSERSGPSGHVAQVKLSGTVDNGGLGSPAPAWIDTWSNGNYSDSYFGQHWGLPELHTDQVYYFILETQIIAYIRTLQPKPEYTTEGIHAPYSNDGVYVDGWYEKASIGLMLDIQGRVTLNWDATVDPEIFIPDLSSEEKSHYSILENFSADSILKIPSPVPEPETYALMLTGLGLVGFVARQGRKQN